MQADANRLEAPRSEGSSIRRATTTREVADRLRAEIQRGELAPGTRLRQNEVANRFGVSTTPVREAFALLEADGLVRIDPHRGALVFLPTVEDVQESYEIREVLEVLALTRAIPRMTPDRLAELQQLVTAMRKTKDDERWLEANTRFHLLLYEPASRPRLEGLIANLRDASAAYIRMYVQRKPHSDDEHQAILDAVGRRDVPGAQRALRRHLRGTVKTLVTVLREAGEKAPPARTRRTAGGRSGASG
jgi:DNA-binding GntR family transcriptional regulator